MGEDHHCDFAAASVRGGSVGVMGGAASERQRGYDVGAGAGGSGVLVRDLFAVAEADVDLCGWA